MRVSNRGESANKDLVKEVNALKAQLKKVSAAMEAESVDGGSRVLNTIESKGKQAIESVIEAAQDFVDEYGDAARDRAAELRDKATESLAETVRHRPLGTLAVVASISFLAGYLRRRH
jgi:ElaB/YqjD/DUF883 family membrane-anchored ribosome-binding protein